MLARHRTKRGARFTRLIACLAALAVPTLPAAAPAGGGTLNALVSAEELPPRDRVEALLSSAQIHRSKGFKRKALPLLEEAHAAAGALPADARYRPPLALASLLYDLGRYPRAIEILNEVLESTSGQRTPARAMVLNEMGLLQSVLNEPDAAIDSFGDSLDIARSLGDQLLVAKVLINRSKAMVTLSDVDALALGLEDLHAVLSAAPSNGQKAELLLAAADLYRSVYWYFDFESIWLTRTYEALTETADTAARLGDGRLRAYAKGYLGRLYEDQGSLEDALRLTREAAFHANAVTAHENAYLWEWQSGRIQNRLGRREDAVASYRQAISTLEHVRQDLIDGSPYTFHQKVQPLYTELSDVLLRAASSVDDQAARQAHLRDVQAVLEQAKSAELQDYFQNDCVLPEQSVELDQVEAATAIVYPVILPDRIEMLVNVHGDIHQFTAPVDANRFEAAVHEFRDQLQVDQGDEEYLELGEELYDLLIRQAEPLLASSGVRTLLFVPDGVLRTVPISALYDGDDFLVEKYAIATTPGLRLTLPKPLELKAASLFAGGISEAVQGFSSLPGVPTELQNLQTAYGASVLQDSEFQRDQVTRELSSDAYSIIHIATHGHFDRNPQNSYLLTYDDKLTMNLLESSIGLRKYLGDPLELLVLSACETAAGDNRAALGLAGVALKAGARSAVATLWQISDAATVQLIDAFYANTSKQEASKAVALQQAQISLLQTERFFHPSDWAPFLLIGNWL